MDLRTLGRILADSSDLQVPNSIYHNDTMVPLPVFLLHIVNRTFLYLLLRTNMSIPLPVPVLGCHIPDRIFL